MMDKIIKELEKFQFTGMEARVYITLLKQPKLNGSQIAKILNTHRPLVYSALDNLYRKGAIYLLPGGKTRYEAKDPKALMGTLWDEYLNSIKFIEDELSQVRVDTSQEQFFNISGHRNVFNKVKELLMTAEKEVYFHTDVDLILFEKELRKLLEKKVRIICFSFIDINSKGLPVEFYYNKKHNIKPGSHRRILLTVDGKYALIASGKLDRSFLGTFSENKLLIKLISEHIHHDIYILKLEEKYGKDLIDADIQLKTNQEQAFFDSLI